MLLIGVGRTMATMNPQFFGDACQTADPSLRSG
jgi:hypothetical protein